MRWLVGTLDQSSVFSAANSGSFPLVGEQDVLYLDRSTGDIYYWTGAIYSLAGGGGGAWGDITGTLSAQTDLQAALDVKEIIYDWNIDLDRQAIFWTDFLQSDRSSLNVAASGAGSTITNDSTSGANSTENARGVVDLITGTTTTGRCSIFSAGTFIFGTHRNEYGIRACPSTGLSDATDRFVMYLGYCDNPGSGDVTDGIFFRCVDNENGGRWQAMVAKAGVRASADTGVSPSNGVFQKFKIIVNQAGTQAQYFIDGSLVATVSSGLPGAGDLTLWSNKIEKSAGTNSRNLSIDWLYDKSSRTTAR